MGIGPADVMSNNFTVFKGKDAIMKAYRFNKVAPWAIFVDRIPMFSYEEYDLEVGEGFLEEAIDNLVECMGNGSYQLRVYKEVSTKGILNNTPFNYGFKFQLLTDDEYEGRHPEGSSVSGLRKRLEALEGGKGGEDDEDEDRSFGAQLGRMFSKPEVQDFVLQKIFGFVNTVFGPKNNMPANMAGFSTMAETQQQTPPTSAELYNALSPDEKQNFDQAAYILMANDPNVGTHLMKLANILMTNPALYQSLTKMAT
jgi:hypothetical protein